MQEVVKDKGGTWFFDGDKTYWCKDMKGNVVGKLYKQYIPDPVKLWESKAQAAGVNVRSHEAKILKPNAVVYKLWEHSQNA